jgi:signal transduction histidine kinase/DNA-binding response OmpR family regulator/streptogramin lyase
MPRSATWQDEVRIGNAWRSRPGLCALLLLVLAADTQSAHAAIEDTRFARLGIKDGLSQNSVTSLVQDHHGFLWIGTQDGLNRYDGYEFKVFRPDADDPAAIPDGMITALALGQDDALWVGTRQGGLLMYLRREDRFLSIHSGPGGTASNLVTALLTARDGTLWVATSQGVSRLRGSPESEEFELVARFPAHALAERADGGILIGAEDGSLHLYHQGVLDALALDSDREGPPGAAIRAILPNCWGHTWIGRHSGELIRLDEHGHVSRLEIGPLAATDPARIRSLQCDSAGGLWVGGLGTGLVHLDPEFDGQSVYQAVIEDPFSLSHNDVLTLLTDREGTLWIGTLSGGLHRLLLGQTGFIHHRRKPGIEGTLSHNIVTAFAHVEGDVIWVGTDGGGINTLDLRTGVFSTVQLVGSPAPGLSRVWALHADRRGGIWAGTWGAGLYYLSPGSDEFNRVTSVPSRIATTIAEDGMSVWVGTTDGIVRLSLDGTLLALYQPDPTDPHGLQDWHTRSLLVDPDGTIWIGTWSRGLVHLDPSQGRFRHYAHLPEGVTGVAHHRVRALARARDGTLWLGTGAGLARLDESRQQVEHLGSRSGLPAGTIYGIVEDLEGRLWLSTNTGLVRHDPVRGTTRTFTPDEGVQDYEFNGGAYLALPDGRALFGGVNGFNIVEPGKIRPARVPPKVVITDFRLFGRTVRHTHGTDGLGPIVAASEIESLELPYYANMLSFRFAAPLPVAPQQLRYAYRLDGFDGDWRIAGPDDRSAVYTNLAPGRYRLLVRSAGVDDLWSSEDRVIELRILPPWWRSIPAYFAYVLALALAIAALVQWRTYALRRHATRLQAEVRERTRRLAEQNHLIEEQAQHLSEALATKEALFARVSHEFRTPLTLIVGPIETLLSQDSQGQKADWLRLMRRNARRLLALVDQLLGLSRLAQKAIPDLSPQAVAPVVENTVAAFDSLASGKGVVLLAGPVEDGWVEATPELLERIITNLVSNAVKYTPRGGRVQVALRRERDALWLSVTDDGPGIAPADHEAIFEPFSRFSEAAQGTGIGLAVVRESAVALGGSVAVESQLGCGAVFSVRIPRCQAPDADSADATQPAPAHSLIHVEVLADQMEAGRLPAAGASVEPEDGRPHVLVVEDNEDLRALLTDALGSVCRCSEAADGRSGLDMAFESVPDLVISDVMMPGIDGFELTRALKQDPRTSHVPVILLTALGDRASRLQGLEEHADDYLVKPFDADELRLKVRNLLDSRQILRQQAGIRVYEAGQLLPETGAAEPDLHGPRERQFLERLQAIVERHYGDSETSVSAIASAVAMTERQLQRKLRGLLNLTPGEYLREYRLQKAAERLATGCPAGVAAMDCGFSSQSYFGSCFKARFGCTPGEYQARSLKMSAD